MRSENPASARSSGQDEPPRRKKPALILEHGQHGGALVLHCRGKLIFRREASELSQAISEMLPRMNAMVVDLAGVEVVDTAGLGELVLLHIWARAGGYRLKFANPNRFVRRVLERTNLISIFEVYSSVALAITAISEELAQPA